MPSPLCSLTAFPGCYTSTTGTSTLSLHDALPISRHALERREPAAQKEKRSDRRNQGHVGVFGKEEHGEGRPGILDVEARSEEHTSELQSRGHLVCRLLLEKKKKNHL